MSSAVEFNATRKGQILYLGKPISLLDGRVLTGCNAYHSSTVICQSADFGILADQTSSIAGPDFAQAFVDRFRGLKSFLPDNGLNEEFVDLLHSSQGVGFQQILLEAILAVEAAVAFALHEPRAVSYAAIKRRATDSDLIWSSDEPTLSFGSAGVGLLGLVELLPIDGRPNRTKHTHDFDTAFAALARRARRRRLAPSTAVIKLAAHRRGIPCAVSGRHHLLLGQGTVQRNIDVSMIGMTSIAPQKLYADGQEANRRQSDLRLPTPRQIKVESIGTTQEAIGETGIAVVVKPINGKKQREVGIQRPSAGMIEKMDRLTQRCASDFTNRRLDLDADFRLLVVGGRLIAASRLLPPGITGDGVSTVANLIDRLNAEPCRDGLRGFPVTVDAEVRKHLAQSGVGLEDVLPQGRNLSLRSTADIFTGGIAIDVTDQVHPKNRELAERVAASVGLDVAGLDIVASDIGQPFDATDGLVIEVNLRPELGIHAWPMVGKPRDVGSELLRLAFPTRNNGRIPVLAVAGDKGTGSTARILDALMRGAGRSVALAMRACAYVDGRLAKLTESQRSKAPLALLHDPRVDTLVTTVSLRQAARRGLLLNDCSVTVIMDRAKAGAAEAFHAGLDIVDRATRDCVVIGSDNRFALQHVSTVKGRRMILVGERQNDPEIRAHLAAGHDVVTTGWHDGDLRISLISGGRLLATFAIDDAITGKDQLGRQRLTRSLMFAIGAAHGAGLSSAVIHTALCRARNAAPASN